MAGPPPGATRETRIRRDRHGRWFDGDVLVENEAVARAFDRWIALAPDGRYCLKNDVNWAYVEIEGAPIFVRDLELTGAGAELALSDETKEPLDPATLRMDDDGFLFCRVRGGTLDAQFTSQASFRLEPVLGEDEDGIYATLDGARITIPRARGSDGSPPPPR